MRHVDVLAVHKNATTGILYHLLIVYQKLPCMTVNLRQLIKSSNTSNYNYNTYTQLTSRWLSCNQLMQTIHSQYILLKYVFYSQIILLCNSLLVLAY